MEGLSELEASMPDAALIAIDRRLTGPTSLVMLLDGSARGNWVILPICVTAMTRPLAESISRATTAFLVPVSTLLNSVKVLTFAESIGVYPGIDSIAGNECGNSGIVEWNKGGMQLGHTKLATTRPAQRRQEQTTRIIPIPTNYASVLIIL